jgi:hypothetical protein
MERLLLSSNFTVFLSYSRLIHAFFCLEIYSGS